MQSITKLFIAAFLVLGLGACAGTTLEQAQSTSSSGGEFSSALNKYYLQRASHEYGYGNYESSDWFASRAIQAANGEAVPPQSPSERMLPSDLEGMVGSSYDRLNAALDGTADTAGAGRDMAPDAAARAQVMFECWMEEGHEGRQPDHIAFCKDEFFAALKEVEAAIEPEPVVMIMEEKVEAIEFLVYYDLGDASMPPIRRLDRLVIPEIIRHNLVINRFLFWAKADKLIRPVDWQPMEEMTEGLKLDAAIIGEIVSFAAAVD